MSNEAAAQDRPVPGPPVIGVDGEAAILRELLDIERKRLAMAHQMEADRNIVFPETTVIVRDIERLLGKVRAKEDAEASGQGEPVADDPLDAMLKELNG